MAQATLNSKGQITIPKHVRDFLQLQVGDNVEFTISSDREALIKPLTKRVDEVFGALHKPGRKPVSVQRMDARVKRKLRANFK